MSRAFKCYAYRNGDRWSAICVDLDVAGDGESFEEAWNSLAICMELYLDGLDGLPPEEGRRLLTRKAPFAVRAKLAFLTAVRGRLGARGARYRRFTLWSVAPRLS